MGYDRRPRPDHRGRERARRSPQAVRDLRAAAARTIDRGRSGHVAARSAERNARERGHRPVVPADHLGCTDRQVGQRVRLEDPRRHQQEGRGRRRAGQLPGLGALSGPGELRAPGGVWARDHRRAAPAGDHGAPGAGLAERPPDREHASRLGDRARPYRRPGHGPRRAGAPRRQRRHGGSAHRRGSGRRPADRPPVQRDARARRGGDQRRARGPRRDRGRRPEGRRYERQVLRQQGLRTRARRRRIGDEARAGVAGDGARSEPGEGRRDRQRGPQLRRGDVGQPRLRRPDGDDLQPGAPGQDHARGGAPPTLGGRGRGDPEQRLLPRRQRPQGSGAGEGGKGRHDRRAERIRRARPRRSARRRPRRRPARRSEHPPR